MGFGLTTTLPRPETIVLTDTDDSSSPSSSPPPPSRLPAPVLEDSPLPSREQPPKKKRRVEDERATPKRRNPKACLQEQVLPHVDRLVRRLPADKVKVGDIGLQTVTALARSPWFRTRLDETNGWLLPSDEARIQCQAGELVKKLSSLPQYQYRRESPPLLVLDGSSQHLSQIQELQPQPSPPTLPPRSDRLISRKGLVIIEPKVRARRNDGKGSTSERARALALPTEPPRDFKPRMSRPRQRREGPPPPPKSKWFQLSQRPYQTATEREAIAAGARHLANELRESFTEPTVYHVDFTQDEISWITRFLSAYEIGKVPETLEAVWCLCRKYNIPSLVGTHLKGRTVEDVRKFCSDVLAKQATAPEHAQLLTLGQDVGDSRASSLRASRLSSLLFARELEGNMGFGRTRQLVNFQDEFRKTYEDGLQVVAEFTNCAGDITTGSWVSEADLICGTTAHSDAHNQQYNKPGNLLLCSTTRSTLRAFPDHRIPRPRVEKGENSTSAMRHSQDPWLYSSVVSSDYDKVHDLAFTSSFDKTVKVWKVDCASGSMEAIATWHHEGNVNFVAVAKDGSGRVATAADVPAEAVRIYTINHENIAKSAYQAFSCSRTDSDGSDNWAYFPATLQWGQAPNTHHLLLVGYSPRSARFDDQDIPEDKRNSGEITLWDATEGRRIPVMTATAANVFEVAWHPTLPRFVVATSPCGLKVDPCVRTQLRIFRQDSDRQDGAYGEFQTLDCYASDINELTLMPNSVDHAYITAACTDGKVYVWDTAQADKPVHTLSHGEPLEEFYEDREREDTGVKFTAWGTSLDRFYTGSSDGIVKVWNVRRKKRPLVRSILETPGPISFGAFSPNHSKLAIGDATGRVFLLSVDEQDEPGARSMALPGTSCRITRAKPFIPHPEPPPPEPESGDSDDEASDAEIGTYTRQKFLDTRQLVLSRNPVIGAVQGPHYAATNLFRRDAHLDQDPSLPLLADFECHQQESQAASLGVRRRAIRRLIRPAPPNNHLAWRHHTNCAQELDASTLDNEELKALVRLSEGLEEDWGFGYEEMPAGLDGTRRDS